MVRALLRTRGRGSRLQRACAYVPAPRATPTFEWYHNYYNPLALSGGAEAGLQDETSQDHQYQTVAELSSVNLSDEHEVETAG